MFSKITDRFFWNSLLAGIFLLIATAATAQTKEVEHSVYITSNTGLRTNETNRQILSQIVEASKKEDSSTLVIIGNVTPEGGFPNKDNGREEVEEYLQKNILDLVKDFKGKVVFTPGYNEWQNDAPDNIDDLESFLQDNAEADVDFWPNDGCPIESESLSDDVQLIMIDSQWYLENWDDHPYINKNVRSKPEPSFGKSSTMNWKITR